ncbi:MAG: HAD family hydrolase [Betaproteobacteria bacterium]|nr:HAD family hydrolase [Betaproteobacteria bacterium]
MSNPSIRAVLWDFGGVITESPFEAFRRFEEARGLPTDFIRTINTINADSNAWARFERSELSLDEFDRAFEAESKTAGHALRGSEIAPLLYGAVRPTMVAALKQCKRHFKNACLTNNVITNTRHGPPTTEDRAAEVMNVLALFDAVVESSKIGARKPERRFYEIALQHLGIRAEEAVFLDDLGINLKPARAMGMATIKVIDPDAALQELETLLRIPLWTPA